MSAMKGGDCTFKKLPHTLIQCEPRQRVNQKAYQYSADFGEKQEVSDQIPLRKVPPVVYVSPGGRHSDFVFSHHFSIFVFNFLIFTSPFWKNGKVKNKNEITLWPPWASPVYITYLKIFFTAFCYFVQRYC